MIVGFPGETDEDFQADLNYLPASPLSHIHVFPYSDRPGTTATSMPDKVNGATIRARASSLRDIGADLSRRFRESQTGTVRPGLTLDDGTLVVTDNYLKVRIPPGIERNRRVAVRLDHDAGTVLDVN
jgi:threonylcarbamoyladenosine tRNA methylthiotransferase MtaB